MSYPKSGGGVPRMPRRLPIILTVGIILFIIAIPTLLLPGCNYVGNFKGTDQGSTCVVIGGGSWPYLEAPVIKEVRQPGSGVKNIGLYDKQRCFPSTQRHYTLTRFSQQDRAQGKVNSDSDAEVEFRTPTLDAQQVYVTGQVLFQLNTDPIAIKRFYKNNAIRTYGGLRPDQGDKGWNKFLAQKFQPILLSSIREAVGQFNCVELNNSCQYAVDPNITKGNRKVTKVENSQNLEAVAARVENILNKKLKVAFGSFKHPIFENIQFNIAAVDFDDQIETAIRNAQAARTLVTTAQLQAQANTERARGRAAVAEQDAIAIRTKAKAYRSNPAQTEIDKIKALCGNDGCDPQVIGSGNIIPNVGGR